MEENFNTVLDENLSSNGEQLTGETISHIEASGKWMRISAYCIIAMLGMFLLLVVKAASAAGSSAIANALKIEEVGELVAVLVVVLLIVGGFLYLYLTIANRYLAYSRNGGEDPEMLERALKTKRLMFIIWGVISIIGIISALAALGQDPMGGGFFDLI